MLQTIILASSVLYELVGPACAKLALYLSGSYGENAPESAPAQPDTPKKSGLETLIERMKTIEEHLPAPVESSLEEEIAFTQAAQEQYDLAQYYHNRPLQGRQIDRRTSRMNMNDPIATLLGSWAIELNIYSILLRVAISVVFAAIIGCERASKRHAAGQRTFILVSLASTMAMMLDKSFSPSNPQIISAAAVIAIAIISQQLHPLQLQEPD